MRRLLALALALLERGREGGGRSGRRFPRVAEVGVAGRTAERVNALQPRKGLGAHASSSLFSGGASRFALNFSLPPLATRLFTFSSSSTYSVPVLSLAASFLFRSVLSAVSCRSEPPRATSVPALRPCRRERFPGSPLASLRLGPLDREQPQLQPLLTPLVKHV